MGYFMNVRIMRGGIGDGGGGRGLWTCNFLKKRLQYWCFPVNTEKYLEIASFIEHLRWLLL